MNQLTPYEKYLKEQLSDLQTPPEEQGWQEMQKLLDRDKKRTPLIPFLSPGCIGSVLLVTTLFLLFWLDPFHWRNNSTDRPEQVSVSTDKTMQKEIAGYDPITSQKNTTAGVTENGVPAAVANGAEPISPVNDFTGNEHGQPIQSIKTHNYQPKKDIVVAGDKRNTRLYNGGQPGKFKATKNVTISKNKSFAGKVNPSVNGSDVVVTRNKKKTTAAGSQLQITAGIASEETASETHVTAGSETESTNITQDIVPVPDSLIVKKEKVISEPVQQHDSAGSNSKYKEKKNLHLAAGLTIYKGIPVGGAIDAAVNQSGRQNALSDYIPSAYLRLYKEQTWFVQAEFRYGVPQYTNAFTYKQSKEQDAMQNVTTTSYKLRKTYYHQLPVSFNYFIMPGWSVGTGVIYNRFKGAVSSESVLQSNARMVNDSLVRFGVVNDKNDSSFVKNTFQWLLETQYKIGHFSIGARYAQGLAPYIKYRDPSTGSLISRKNNSVYLFLRYELWKQHN